MYVYRGWVRVFIVEGNEVYYYGGCDFYEYVYGELVEVFFGGLSYLIVVFYIESEGSYVRL